MAGSALGLCRLGWRLRASGPMLCWDLGLAEAPGPVGAEELLPLGGAPALVILPTAASLGSLWPGGPAVVPAWDLLADTGVLVDGDVSGLWPLFLTAFRGCFWLTHACLVSDQCFGALRPVGCEILALRPDVLCAGPSLRTGR